VFAVSVAMHVEVIFRLGAPYLLVTFGTKSMIQTHSNSPMPSSYRTLQVVALLLLPCRSIMPAIDDDATI